MECIYSVWTVCILLNNRCMHAMWAFFHTMLTWNRKEVETALICMAYKISANFCKYAEEFHTQHCGECNTNSVQQMSVENWEQCNSTSWVHGNQTQPDSIPSVATQWNDLMNEWHHSSQLTLVRKIDVIGLQTLSLDRRSIIKTICLHHYSAVETVIATWHQEDNTEENTMSPNHKKYSNITQSWEPSCGLTRRTYRWASCSKL